MRFAKYHGTGNDFVMVEDLDDRLRLGRDLIAALCDRHRGVGADGLIRVAPAEGADFFMDYYNADGEPAEMCGNGIRCLAKLVVERGHTSSRELDVLTRAGVKHVVIDEAGGVVRGVTVDMGAPRLERPEIPMAGGDGRFLEQPLEAAGRTFVASAVSMGNPHCVVFLDGDTDLASLDVRGIGTQIEHLPLFPNRTNVEFVTVRDGRIVVRVWERGSGDTMACGTGACASLVACALAERTERSADVEFPGGVLRVEWTADDRLLMTGSAVRVFEGVLDDAWIGERRGAVESPPDAVARDAPALSGSPS